MEALGEEAVIIYQDRVAFAGFIIPGFDQDSLHGGSVHRIPCHQFGLSPGDSLGLLSQIRYFPGLPEIQVCDPQIRKFGIGLPGIQDAVRFAGFGHQAVFFWPVQLQLHT